MYNESSKSFSLIDRYYEIIESFVVSGLDKNDNTYYQKWFAAHVKERWLLMD